MRVVSCAPQRPADASLIERDQLDGLIAAAGVGATREIVAAFYRSTETLLADLRQQSAAGDFAAAGRTAHALKGSAANLGAVELARAASGLEGSCRERLIDQGCIEKLAAIYARTASALDLLLAEHRD